MRKKQQQIFRFLLQNLQIQISSLDDTTTEFDLIGVDAAIANAFRRILIAELPSMVKINSQQNKKLKSIILGY